MSKTGLAIDVLQRWHKCDIPGKELKALMRRTNRHGLIQTTAYFTILIALGIAAYYAIGTGWMIPAFFLYGTVYCFTNHMMHETHHRTPFRTLRLNNTVNWIASFLNGVEPIFNRWGHTQHHTYTYFYGTDPEVETSRPANIPQLLGKCIGIGLVNPLPIIKHAFGIITEPAKTYVPREEWRKMIWSSRGWLVGYGLIIVSCFIFKTPLPIVYTMLARFYGALLAKTVDYTQHIGLQSDVYDHRLCTRNVKLNPILRFLYWNMNYHIEHHMFPAIPFHALSKLHTIIQDQLPRTYNGLFDVYRELVPTIIRQQRQPGYCVTPVLPEKNAADSSLNHNTNDLFESGDRKMDEHLLWLQVCEIDELDINDVIGFEHSSKQYAVYRLTDGYFATDGKCSHAGALLADGFVIDDAIECPAHQGRFDIRTGKATCSPACVNIKTFAAKAENGHVYIGIPH